MTNVQSTTIVIEIEDRIAYANLDRLAPASGPISIDFSGLSTSEIASEGKSRVNAEYVMQRVNYHILVLEKDVT